MQRLRPLLFRHSNHVRNVNKIHSQPHLKNIYKSRENVCSTKWVQSRLNKLSSMDFSTNANLHVEKKSKSKSKNFASNVTKTNSSSGSKVPKNLNLNLVSVTHSRHHQPPTAPFDMVEPLTNEILSAPVGSLFSFDENESTKFHHPHDVSETTTQKVEYILRGHSALIPNSILDVDLLDPLSKQIKHRRDIPDPSTDPDRYKLWQEARLSMTANERLSVMLQLVKRLEQEGEHYQQKAEEHRLAQLAPTLNNSDEDSSDNDTSTTSTPTSLKTKKSNAPKQRPVTVPKTIQEQYSIPGPSINIYDLVLDAYAVSAQEISSQQANTSETSTSAPDAANTLDMLEQANSLYEQILERHNLDGRHNNTNPKTIPTEITYNALIRMAANAPYIQDNTVSNLSKLDIPTQRVRDTALSISLRNYEQMLSSDCVERNAATYTYVLKTIQKFIPECRSRGNIVNALFKSACEEGLVDTSVTEALVGNGGGKEYEEWVVDVAGKDAKKTPHEWSRLVRKRQSKFGARLY